LHLPGFTGQETGFLTGTEGTMIQDSLLVPGAQLSAQGAHDQVILVGSPGLGGRNNAGVLTGSSVLQLSKGWASPML
jgi:hypothetical protein